MIRRCKCSGHDQRNPRTRQIQPSPIERRSKSPASPTWPTKTNVTNRSPTGCIFGLTGTLRQQQQSKHACVFSKMCHRRAGWEISVGGSFPLDDQVHHSTRLIIADRNLFTSELQVCGILGADFDHRHGGSFRRASRDCLRCFGQSLLSMRCGGSWPKNRISLATSLW